MSNAQDVPSSAKSISFVRHPTSHPSSHKAARIAAGVTFAWIQSGLREVLADGSPARQLAKANFDAHQDESHDVVEISENALVACALAFSLNGRSFRPLTSKPVMRALYHGNAHHDSRTRCCVFAISGTTNQRGKRI